MKMQISINQLADFQSGSDSKKKRIILQQKDPNPFRIAYYQLAKARMKKSIQNQGSLQSVIEAISILKSREPEKKRQINDNKVSIEALQRFIKMQVPSYLRNIDYEIVKAPKQKSIIIGGVEILVSPDVIIRFRVDGNIYLGAVKIHISKSNAFDGKQQTLIAAALFEYLRTNVASADENVLGDFCLSLDIFGGGYTSLPSNPSSSLHSLHDSCDEVKMYWNVA